MRKEGWILLSVMAVALSLYLGFKLAALKKNPFCQTEVKTEGRKISFPFKEKVGIFILTSPTKRSCGFNMDDKFQKELFSLSKKDQILVMKINIDEEENEGFVKMFALFMPSVLVLNNKGKPLFSFPIPFQREKARVLLNLIKEIVLKYMLAEKGKGNCFSRLRKEKVMNK